MGKRGLYPMLSTKNTKKITGHYMDLLQYADGKNDLESISTLLNIKLSLTNKMYNILKKNNLVV